MIQNVFNNYPGTRAVQTRYIRSIVYITYVYMRKRMCSSHVISGCMKFSFINPSHQSSCRCSCHKSTDLCSRFNMHMRLFRSKGLIIINFNQTYRGTQETRSSLYQKIKSHSAIENCPSIWKNFNKFLRSCNWLKFALNCRRFFLSFVWW